MKKLVSWIEIPVVDFNRAVKFYQNILNIELDLKGEGEEKMALFPGGEGALFFKPGFNPAKEGVIINLDAGKEFDVTIKKISDNGGKIVTPKTPVKSGDQGYYALFIDSEGNRMGLNGK